MAHAPARPVSTARHAVGSMRQGRRGHARCEGASSRQLEAARTRGRPLELLAPLSDAELIGQHSPLMSPLVWDLAHIGHFEELWICRWLGGRPIRRLEVDDTSTTRSPTSGTRARRAPAARPGLPRSPTSPRSARGRSSVLDRRRARRRRSAPRGRLRLRPRRPARAAARRDDAADDPASDHGPADPEPARTAAARRPGRRARRSSRRAVRHGHRRRAVGYDNERPAHEVDVAAVPDRPAPGDQRRVRRVRRRRRLRRRRGSGPTRAGSGARRPALAHPQCWRRDGDGAWCRPRFGRREARPARRAGPARLLVRGRRVRALGRASACRPRPSGRRPRRGDPTAGARRFPWGDAPPRRAREPRTSGTFGPAPVGAYPAARASSAATRCSATSGSGRPVRLRAPTRASAPFPYREYSEVFFGDEYKVLRGGSWATHPIAIRTTFRNWDLPDPPPDLRRLPLRARRPDVTAAAAPSGATPRRRPPLGRDDRRDALRDDVRAGLTSTPKELPPKWFYDDRGSRALRRDHPAARVLPDPRASARSSTRARRRSPHAAAPTRSSSSARARRRRRGSCSTRCATPGRLRRFVPFDVSEQTLRDAAGRDRRASTRHRGARGRRRLRAPPRPAARAAGARLVAFLGGTIGNLAPARTRDVPRRACRAALGPGDALLLGTDLVKDVDAARGRVRRRRPASPPSSTATCCTSSTASSTPTSTPTRSRTSPAGTPDEEWIEMRCAPTPRSACTIAALDLEVDVRRRRGDAHRDQRQVPPRGVEAELAAAGLELAQWWTDRAGDFAVALALVGRGRRPLMIDSPRTPCDKRGFHDEPGRKETEVDETRRRVDEFRRRSTRGREPPDRRARGREDQPPGVRAPRRPCSAFLSALVRRVRVWRGRRSTPPAPRAPPTRTAPRQLPAGRCGPR